MYLLCIVYVQKSTEMYNYVKNVVYLLYGTMVNVNWLNSIVALAPLCGDLQFILCHIFAKSLNKAFALSLVLEKGKFYYERDEKQEPVTFLVRVLSYLFVGPARPPGR